MDVIYYYAVMSITVLVGEQRGDEGKGRFVDLLMPEYEIGARFNGGDNAGHTVVVDDCVYKLHGLPTSIVHPNKKSVMGEGVVINPLNLVKEIDTLREQGVHIGCDNLLISSSAHLIQPSHISEDEIRESGDDAQGSTKSGIAPVYGHKAYRDRESIRAEHINNNPQKIFEVVERGLLNQRHLRVEEWQTAIDEEAVAYDYVEAAQRLGEFVTDTCLFLNRELELGKKVLAEGAQAFLLDIDQGMYPFVTSSSTIAGGASPGLGVSTKAIDRVVGISKAIQSHVGGGPFVTEINDPRVLARIHGDMTTVDAERGTTTGRTRRLGFLDLPGIRRAQMINETDEMALTKLDWVPRFGDTIPVCVAYERKGKTLEFSPNAAYKLEESTPIYEELPNWRRDISDVRKFKDLPKPAKRYVKYLEEMTGVPISMLGVGPERDQVVIR